MFANKERASVAFGWIFAAHQLGAATAAFGAGFSKSVLASYVPAFVAAGAMCSWPPRSCC